MPRYTYPHCVTFTVLPALVYTAVTFTFIHYVAVHRTRGSVAVTCGCRLRFIPHWLPRLPHGYAAIWVLHSPCRLRYRFGYTHAVYGCYVYRYTFCRFHTRLLRLRVYVWFITHYAAVLPHRWLPARYRFTAVLPLPLPGYRLVTCGYAVGRLRFCLPGYPQHTFTVVRLRLPLPRTHLCRLRTLHTAPRFALRLVARTVAFATRTHCILWLLRLPVLPSHTYAHTRFAYWFLYTFTVADDFTPLPHFVPAGYLTLDARTILPATALPVGSGSRSVHVPRFLVAFALPHATGYTMPPLLPSAFTALHTTLRFPLVIHTRIHRYRAHVHFHVYTLRLHFTHWLPVVHTRLRFYTTVTRLTHILCHTCLCGSPLRLRLVTPHTRSRVTRYPVVPLPRAVLRTLRFLPPLRWVLGCCRFFYRCRLVVRCSCHAHACLRFHLLPRMPVTVTHSFGYRLRVPWLRFYGLLRLHCGYTHCSAYGWVHTPRFTVVTVGCYHYTVRYVWLRFTAAFVTRFAPAVLLIAGSARVTRLPQFAGCRTLRFCCTRTHTCTVYYALVGCHHHSYAHTVTRCGCTPLYRLRFRLDYHPTVTLLPPVAVTRFYLAFPAFAAVHTLFAVPVVRTPAVGSGWDYATPPHTPPVVRFTRCSTVLTTFPGYCGYSYTTPVCLRLLHTHLDCLRLVLLVTHTRCGYLCLRIATHPPHLYIPVTLPFTLRGWLHTRSRPLSLRLPRIPYWILGYILVVAVAVPRLLRLVLPHVLHTAGCHCITHAVGSRFVGSHCYTALPFCIPVHDTVCRTVTRVAAFTHTHTAADSFVTRLQFCRVLVVRSSTFTFSTHALRSRLHRLRHTFAPRLPHCLPVTYAFVYRSHTARFFVWLPVLPFAVTTTPPLPLPPPHGWLRFTAHTGSTHRLPHLHLPRSTCLPGYYGWLFCYRLRCAHTTCATRDILPLYLPGCRFGYAFGLTLHVAHCLRSRSFCGWFGSAACLYRSTLGYGYIWVTHGCRSLPARYTPVRFARYLAVPVCSSLRLHVTTYLVLSPFTPLLPRLHFAVPRSAVAVARYLWLLVVRVTTF